MQNNGGLFNSLSIRLSLVDKQQQSCREEQDGEGSWGTTMEAQEKEELGAVEEEYESTISTSEETSTTADGGFESIQWYPLKNLTSVGPKESKRPYASIYIIDPVITVERHHGKYHVAVRFNIETTILHYEAQRR